MLFSRLYERYREDKRFLYVVMERVKGGELFEAYVMSHASPVSFIPLFTLLIASSLCGFQCSCHLRVWLVVIV